MFEKQEKLLGKSFQSPRKIISYFQLSIHSPKNQRRFWMQFFHSHLRSSNLSNIPFLAHKMHWAVSLNAKGNKVFLYIWKYNPHYLITKLNLISARLQTKLLIQECRSKFKNLPLDLIPLEILNAEIALAGNKQKESDTR